VDEAGSLNRNEENLSRPNIRKGLRRIITYIMINPVIILKNVKANSSSI
jgi:hypothetical protein